MDKTDIAVTKAARLLKLMASPTRLRILRQIGRAALDVSTVAENIGMTHSAVSHQLSVFLAAGVLERKTAGRFGLYSFTATPEAKAIKAILKLV